MAMNYTSLVAPKGTAGSIANWVGYGKLDIATVLDEAQSIIFQSLRVREMRTEWIFGLNVGDSQIGLPVRFLDPIGRLRSSTGQHFGHLTESDISNRRSYSQSSGTLGNNAITTTSGAPTLALNLPSHRLIVGSDVTILGGVDFNGIVVNHSFKVVGVTDADNLLIFNTDIVTATASGTGGGAAMTYMANALVGTPSAWAVWDNLLVFDGALDVATQFRLICYKSPQLLSATNTVNFLTNRYPRLIREATNAAAASFMKDDNEETKALQKLSALIEATNAESDLMYRGADLTTDTPGARDYL